MIESPSSRVLEKASRRDLSRTETCGGGKSISWTPLRVSNFLGIYSCGIRSNGAGVGPQGTRARQPPQARPGGSWPPPLASGLLSKLVVLYMFRKKSPKSFVSFDLHLVLIFYKTKNRQKTATDTGHLVNRLVPKNDI